MVSETSDAALKGRMIELMKRAHELGRHEELGQLLGELERLEKRDRHEAEVQARIDEALAAREAERQAQQELPRRSLLSAKEKSAIIRRDGLAHYQSLPK